MRKSRRVKNIVGSAPNWECWFHTFRVEQFPKWCKAVLLWFAIVGVKAVSRQPKTPGDILSLTRIPLESSCQEIKELCQEGRGIKEERAGETSTSTANSSAKWSFQMVCGRKYWKHSRHGTESELKAKLRLGSVFLSMTVAQRTTSLKAE